MTAAHEIGHFLDHQGIGDASRFASKDHHSEMMLPWAKAVSDSKAHKQPAEMFHDPPEVKHDQGHWTYKADTRYISYLSRPEEKFARSYAQYVAIRSGDKEILRELDEERKRAGKIYYPTQWDDDDFEPIAVAFDDLFKKSGRPK